MFTNDVLVTSAAVVRWVAVQVILAPTARLAGRVPPQLRALMPVSASVSVRVVRGTLPSLVMTIV